MRSCHGLAAGLLVLAGVAVGLADDRPLREARSANDGYLLEIEPGRPGRNGRPPRAVLRKRVAGRGAGTRVWENRLVNDVAPLRVFIRGDGKFVVTLDEYRRGGTRNALVIYGTRGELLRHFLLQDLLTAADWQHVDVRKQSLHWSDAAQGRFKDGFFELELEWGRTLRIDLKWLRVERPAGVEPACGAENLPAALLALLFEHVEGGGAEQVSEAAEPLEEVGALTPEEQEQAATIQEMLSGEDADSASLEEEPVPVLAADAEALEIGAEVPAEVSDEMSPEAEPELAVEEPAVAEVVEEELELAESLTPPGIDVDVPAPDARNPTDYVAWINELGQVDGPDATPLYDAAIDALIDWEGDAGLLRAALAGDPAALSDAQVTAWLAQNAAALAAFSEGSQLATRSWNFESDDGSLMSLRLPSLSPLRTLGRGSVIVGREAAADGQVVVAADHYLDTLAAGAHTGEGLTIIENLVGAAMQEPAADALLDLQAEHGDELDFDDLVEAAEVAYSPVRPAVETLQGERAFFMDTCQRLWVPDPNTGELSFDADRAAQFVDMVGDDNLAEGTDEMAARLSEIGYAETVAEANAVYDRMSAAFLAPYPQGDAELRVLEESVLRTSDANPLVRTLVPALSRYHLVHTRAEARRRAVLLTTRLNAYQQEHGSYPDSLAVFGDDSVVVDPFSDAPFVYRVVDGDFELYSVGGDGVADTAGQDPDSDGADVRYWPRAEKVVGE